MRPVGLLPWTFRLADSTNLRDIPTFIWGMSTERGRMTYPVSSYAPRGGLQPPEHPPRSVLA
jgi:hypothetical protein